MNKSDLTLEKIINRETIYASSIRNLRLILIHPWVNSLSGT